MGGEGEAVRIPEVPLVQIMDPTPEPRRLEFPKLPAFQAIEDTCPLWHCARTVIDSAIPQRFSFSLGVPDGYPDQAGLDWGSLRWLMSKPPEEYWPDIAHRLRTLEDL